MEDRVSREKLDRYFGLTSKALGICKDSVAEGREDDAKEIFEMVENYLSDARFFDEEKGDLVLAFGCLNYAHGWIDCGVRLGVFSVTDRDLFTVK